MPGFARQELIKQGQVGSYYCVVKCVRSASLLGSGTGPVRRAEWIEERIHELVKVFAVEVGAFAVTKDTLHLVVRLRPDVAKTWDAVDVARRWLTMFPKRRKEDGQPARPQPVEIEELTRDRKGMTEKRNRLADLSWFMRCLCEYVARKANREDGGSGRFWEGRFKCVALLDQHAVLACMAHVDLCPLLVGESTTLEAPHGSFKLRKLGKLPRNWLAPIGVETPNLPQRPKTNTKTSAPKKAPAKAAPAKPAAAAKGAGDFLQLDSTKYVRLLDWSSKMLNVETPPPPPPSLHELLLHWRLDVPRWLGVAANFERWFHRAAGRVESIANEAESRDKRWFAGITKCREVFGE